MKAELITGTEAALQKTTVNQSITAENAFKDKLTQAQKAQTAGIKPLTLRARPRLRRMIRNCARCAATWSRCL